MDQSRYWTPKDQPCLNPHVFGDTWEEQAFAEDATGALGGCVWPPRSYSCSFCRREFRSAQALGGHMNVHRRDRARLKKISTSNNNQLLDLPPASFDICLFQNPNPNLDLDHDQPLYPSSSKPSTLSIIRPFSYSFGQDHQKGTSMLSCSKFELPQKRFHIPYSEDDHHQDKGSRTTKVLESNSLVRKRCDDKKDDEDECLIFKKRRIDDHQAGGARSFFPKKTNYLVNGDEAESVLPLEGSTNSSLETLDLELRLGDHRP